MATKFIITRQHTNGGPHGIFAGYGPDKLALPMWHKLDDAFAVVLYADQDVAHNQRAIMEKTELARDNFTYRVIEIEINISGVI